MSKTNTIEPEKSEFKTYFFNVKITEFTEKENEFFLYLSEQMATLGIRVERRCAENRKGKRKISEVSLDNLMGVLRGNTINHIATESDIKASLIEDALLGKELADADAKDIEDMIYEYSQE